MPRNFNPENLPSPELTHEGIMLTSGRVRRAKEGREHRCEDDILAFDSGDVVQAVYGVFDGVGGHFYGQEAAETAKKILKLYLEQHHRGTTKNISQRDPKKIGADLRDCLLEANDRLFRWGEKLQIEKAGPSTTATVLMFTQSKEKGLVAVIAHVGDSRVYLFRGGKLECLTLDDNPLIKQSANPKETQIQLSNTHDHALLYRRNELSKALGFGKYLEPQILETLAQKGDLFLITTDGITDNLTDEEIERTLEEAFGTMAAPQEKDLDFKDLISSSAKLLYEKALEISRKNREEEARVHPDDMTAIIVKVE